MTTPTQVLQRIALAGNPNTGKTTLFNRLTGARAKVGNYPGVTVEREEGEFALGGGERALAIDVPGTYSLTARSGEEEIAIREVCGLERDELPDLVVLVVDATQLSRNLYLALQVIETGVPTVIALNMIDLLAERGLEIDIPVLQIELGVPVVPISANTGAGLQRLREVAWSVLQRPEIASPGARWTTRDPELLRDLDQVARCLPQRWHRDDPRRTSALALWALLSLDEHDELSGATPDLRATVLALRQAAKARGRDIETEIIQGRYAWIDARIPILVRAKPAPAATSTDRIDRVLLHPFIGFAVFLLTMGVVFQSLFSWTDPAIRGIEFLVGWLGDRATAVLPAGMLADFVQNGLIAGVGSVLVFLPQIALLFLFIGVMEDSGYMARVAFLMDRLMKAIGLHGRAFVPMMSGFACAVPAILATRTMERRRDRLLSMMVIPLMTCSARLPVYSLIIAALFPPSDVFGFVPVQGLLMVGMYLFSTVTTLVAAAVLGRTLLKGKRMPFLLEMPPYRMPHWASVLHMMWVRSRVFVVEGGSVILVCSIVIWAMLRFPWTDADAAAFETRRAEVVTAGLSPEETRARLGSIAHDEAGERVRSSFGGRLGHALEPALEPLGFDWKIGIGLIGAFAAREVFVSTMGVVYGLGADADEGSVTLRDRIRTESHADGRPVYTPLVGLSLMIFFALACQCMSTLAAVKREIRSWRWPAFLFVYMSVLAWIASFAVYQGGRWLGFS